MKATEAAKALDRLCKGTKRAPSLPALAAFINEHLTQLHAETERGYCNTDRKVGRLRIPGKGPRIIVRRVWNGDVVFDHNNAETYRHTGEVVFWIATQAKHRDPNSFIRRWVSW